mmetsp:Transcript_14312/g.45716  ORF Transcript_14312/g.45716 Transcript_14312/m.45716 type:complete len:217 (+) Transcript_14312:1049-1699(+)
MHSDMRMTWQALMLIASVWPEEERTLGRRRWRLRLRPVPLRVAPVATQAANRAPTRAVGWEAVNRAPVGAAVAAVTHPSLPHSPVRDQLTCAASSTRRSDSRRRSWKSSEIPSGALVAELGTLGHQLAAQHPAVVEEGIAVVVSLDLVGRLMQSPCPPFIRRKGLSGISWSWLASTKTCSRCEGRPLVTPPWKHWSKRRLQRQAPSWVPLHSRRTR